MMHTKRTIRPLEIRTVTDLSGLEPLRRGWTALLDASVRPTVFAAWEWQYLCAKHMANGKNIVVLTVYDGDRLVAVLPLHREKTKAGGLISTDVLACLGGDITDYNVLLVREHYLSAVIPALAEHLRQIGSALDFRNVLPGTPLHILVQYLAKTGFAIVPFETKMALYSHIGMDYDAFIRGRKRNFRKNLNNHQHDMERAGGYASHEEEPSDELLRALVKLHTGRWQCKGEPGALSHTAVRAFHAELQDMAVRPFDIQYYTIRHHGQIVAVLYGFIFRRCFYAYLSGFDMLHASISPGNMARNVAIRNLIKRGVVGFDMLRGDMHYKQSWATGSMEMRDAILFPPSIGGRLAAMTMKTIMRAKRLIPASIKRGLKSTIGGSASPADHPADDKDTE